MLLTIMTSRFIIIHKSSSYFINSLVANIIVEVFTDDDISVLFARWQCIQCYRAILRLVPVRCVIRGAVESLSAKYW